MDQVAILEVTRPPFLMSQSRKSVSECARFAAKNSTSFVANLRAISPVWAMTREEKFRNPFLLTQLKVVSVFLKFTPWSRNLFRLEFRRRRFQRRKFAWALFYLSLKCYDSAESEQI